MRRNLLEICANGMIRVCAAASAMAVAALWLGGCSAMMVKLGAKVELTKTPLASIQASIANPAGIAPGEKLPLVLTLTQPDGKVLKSEGAGGGPVMWKELSVTATVASVNQKGEITLPADPRQSEGLTPHVVITVPSHPDLRTELDIPLRYNRGYSCNFSGAAGTSGSSGLDGIMGSPGTPGSMDPNNPSSGGNGGDGTNGSDGQDGGTGGDAANVLIRVRLEPASYPLLQIEVSARGKDQYFLIDPRGGSLTISADGGAGGSGGHGGRGGQGGSGGIGIPNGSQGRNGMDGRNGSDGMPGRGGSIRVAHDPAAEPYLGVFHLSSRYGPAPSFLEQPLGELW